MQFHIRAYYTGMVEKRKAVRKKVKNENKTYYQQLEAKDSTVICNLANTSSEYSLKYNKTRNENKERRLLLMFLHQDPHKRHLVLSVALTSFDANPISCPSGQKPLNSQPSSSPSMPPPVSCLLLLFTAVVYNL